jgi:glutamate-1-semialdehyde aminotransferase/spore coat polysaccharide biosynthesis protein SpsF (cytidylyltransferase family)
MLLHIAERLKRANTIDNILFATSTSTADDPIFQLAHEHGIQCFRGNEEDVLDRFYQAIRGNGADTVVRITADCPFTDPGVVDRVVQKFLQARPDYAVHPRPQGLDAEVFTRTALEQAWAEAHDPVDREHVTTYIRFSGKFNTLVVEPDMEISDITNGWSVDSEADLRFARAVYELLYRSDHNFGVREVLQLLREKPELMRINADQNRYEGYYRSIAFSNEESPPPSCALTRSYQLKGRARRLIPSGTHSLSEAPTQHIQAVAPVFLLRGTGSHVWDVDGNEYIDYPMALGTVILGHNYPSVSEAVRETLRSGTSFSLPHPLEVELAELLCEMIPCAEMVRFGKNSSDVTTAAIRAARAITGRHKVAFCNHNRWLDWCNVQTTRDKGVPPQVAELTLTFLYNDLESLEWLFRDNPAQIAAVIMEPVGVEEPNPGFLEGVRELANHNGALLIFDEILTGFRISLGGAQEYFRVVPDLATFGKAMANGIGISALVGKRAHMEIFDEIFLSSAFTGETIGLAAAVATLRELRLRNVIEHIWNQGRKLKEGYMALVRQHGLLEYTECVGLPSRTVITFKDKTGAESLAMKTLFHQECLKRGILFSGGQNPSFSHSDADIDRTLRVYSTALRKLRSAIDVDNV